MGKYEIKLESMMTLPSQLAINACTTTGPVSGAVSSRVKQWASSGPEVTFKLTPTIHDKADWSDPDIGWGLILPERPSLSPEQLARADDAPTPIQKLVEIRNKRLQEKGGSVPIFRYRSSSPNRLSHLRNYASESDIAIYSDGERGTGPKALPWYLLIYGSPDEIPWELQYTLNTTAFVGRLDLQDQALENYVDALLHDWQASTLQKDHAVVWAVDHAIHDITTLMRNAIAHEVYRHLNGDLDLQGKVSFIDGSTTPAHAGDLIGALSTNKPSLVVTTSHGWTEPLSNPSAMRDTLGLPVDHDLAPLQPGPLLEQWDPNGAVWYAHACCSAGCDSTTIYDGLVQPGSDIDLVLKALSGTGPITSPLPHKLLGASRPLRAFIGHVEPTFDWTMYSPQTGQFFMKELIHALYNELYVSHPVGLAFHGYFQTIATLSTHHANAVRRIAWDEMLYCKLVARDRQSMVILGDPTVALPSLH